MYQRFISNRMQGAFDVTLNTRIKFNNRRLKEFVSINQIYLSEYTLNGNPIYFVDNEAGLDGINNLFDVGIQVSNKPVGYTMINLYSASEVKAGHKQVQVKVPVYEVTVTNESGQSSTFLYTRYNLRANINKNDAIEDRTFDVNKSGDVFDGVIKSRWKGKNNVLELRARGRLKFEDQTGVIGMKGDMPNVERVAIQFHVLGASDGCLLAVGKANLLGNSYTTLKYSDSKTAQPAFMSTIQSYRAEDKKNGFSSSIHVYFDRLHDNPNYQNDINGNSLGWHAPMVLPSKMALPSKFDWVF